MYILEINFCTVDIMEHIVGFAFEFVEHCDDFDDVILDHITSMQQTCNKYFGTDVERHSDGKEHAYECIRRMVLELRSKEETVSPNTLKTVQT
jgi:hypothetical protein